MKGVKLSRTSWLILAAGVFLVVLAALGLTRSQQMKDQSKLAGDLDASQKKLATINTAPLSQQLENLKVKVDESTTLLESAQARLRQTVISVDVTDEFFKIANDSSVNVTTMATSTINTADYGGISLSTTSLSASVAGTVENVIKFINALNNGYLTGNVDSAQISFGKDEEAPPAQEGGDTEGGQEIDQSQVLAKGEAKASVGMTIYSYEGK
jgi:hypothetical protein